MTGARGRLGSHIVARLAAEHHDAEHHHVVALTRRPVPAQPGVTVRIAAYDDSRALRAALADVNILVLVSSDGEAELVLQHHLNLIAAATAAPIEHLILLSSVDSDRASPFCYARVNALTEHAVRASGLDHTVVRASIYTEFLGALCAAARLPNVLRLPAAAGRIGLVARRDVARCLAACALCAPTGGPINVTGPRSVTLADVAGHLGVAYEPVSEREFLRDLAGRESPWWSYAYASMFASIREQRWDATSDAVQRLTGEAPQPVSSVLVKDPA